MSVPATPLASRSNKRTYKANRGVAGHSKAQERVLFVLGYVVIIGIVLVAGYLQARGLI